MVAIKEDFLRLLREDDEFRSEVRRAVLTDELLNLPNMFAQMTVRMDGMAEQIARNTEQIARNTEQIARNSELIAENGKQIAENGKQIVNLALQMADMNARLQRTENDVSVLKGDMMEVKMVNRIVPFISGKLELRSGFVVRGGQPNEVSTRFDDLLYDAYKSGAIDEWDRDRINATDLIISAVSRVSGARVYVAVEASYVVDDRDVSRAQRSANILAKAFPDAETHAAVYGRHVNPNAKKDADKFGVFMYGAPPDGSAAPPSLSEIPR